MVAPAPAALTTPGPAHSAPGARAGVERPMTSPGVAAYSAAGGIDGRFRHPAAAFILNGPEAITKLW